MARLMLVALVVTVACGCGGASKRAAMLAEVRGQLTAPGVQSRAFDRHSGLVGPPEVKQCDPPLEAWRSGDNATRYGYATIYACQSEAQARSPSVPALPGQQYRSGRVLAVVTADAPLARDIRAALRQAR